MSVNLSDSIGTTRFMMNNIERNQQIVIAFYDLMFSKNRPAESIAKYVGDTYIQHNPRVKNGKDGFVKYFNRMAKGYPGKKVTFKKVIAEKNVVVLHCFQEWPEDKNYASIDIFRLSENGNSMFQVG